MNAALILIGITIVIIASILAARPSIKRYAEARRIQAAKDRQEAEARRERERRSEEVAKARILAQPEYFRGYGIKVAEKMATPRAADAGTVHLTHPICWSYDDDDGLYSGTEKCAFGCGELFAMHEIGAFAGQGVKWMYLGRYCPACGALSHTYNTSPTLEGPLGRRLKGATNLFDTLGPPKSEELDAEWTKLEAEQSSLEARLNVVRARRLALAEKLGKPIDSGPFRPRLLAGGKES